MKTIIQKIINFFSTEDKTYKLRPPTIEIMGFHHNVISII